MADGRENAAGVAGKLNYRYNGGQRFILISFNLCSFRRQGFVLDEGLKDCWARFTDKSDEKFFRKFVKGFVAQWEGKVCPNWEMMVTARLEGEKDEGPRLADLPEELLPALSKFLFVGEDEAEEVNPFIERERWRLDVKFTFIS